MQQPPKTGAITKIYSCAAGHVPIGPDRKSCPMAMLPKTRPPQPNGGAVSYKQTMQDILLPVKYGAFDLELDIVTINVLIHRGKDVVDALPVINSGLYVL